MSGQFDSNKFMNACPSNGKQKLLIKAQLQMSCIAVNLVILERIDPFNQFLETLEKADSGSTAFKIRNTYLAINTIKDHVFAGLANPLLEVLKEQTVAMIKEVTDNFKNLQPLDLIIDPGLTPQQFYLEWVNHNPQEDLSLLPYLYYPWRIIQTLTMALGFLRRLRDQEIQRRNKSLNIKQVPFIPEERYCPYSSFYRRGPRLDPYIKLKPEVFKSIQDMARERLKVIVPRHQDCLSK